MHPYLLSNQLLSIWSYRSNKVKLVLSKVGEVLDLMCQFANKHKIEDTLIIQMTSLSLPIFFVEGLDQLQLVSLNLISTVCIYHPHCSPINLRYKELLLTLDLSIFYITTDLLQISRTSYYYLGRYLFQLVQIAKDQAQHPKLFVCIATQFFTWVILTKIFLPLR